jgi:DNA-binding transcriptional MerR regulator
MGLMGIGEFARLSRLSPKALRLYDELGLLAPARVDPDSGYRWYSPGQLEQARLVASLRRIGVPLAQITVILGLEAPAAADRVCAYWAEAEADHAARRALVGFLVDRLHGKRSVMYEVSVRDVPERTLLCLLRHVRHDELFAVGREFIARFREGVPRVEGVFGAAFVVYLGEVSQDSDGPIEWCRPIPGEQAAQIAARFPDLTLRTQGAYQEAFVRQGPATRVNLDQTMLAFESLFAWAAEQKRKLNGAPRQVFIQNPANGEIGPDSELGIPLR